MAKSRRGLSDAMSVALIKGERDIYEAEGKQREKNRQQGIQSIKDLSKYLVGLANEKEKTDAILDAHMEDLGGAENINLLEEDYNKQAVTDFLRDGRLKYNEAAKMFEETKDMKYRDEMNNIKFSFQNLNAQLGGLAQERAEYMTAHGEGELIQLEGDNKYVDIYTNKGQFAIEGNGDIGFTTGDNEYNKLKDIAGKWNSKQYTSETAVLENNDQAVALGRGGKPFVRDSIKNKYNATFRKTGKRGIMAMAKTDITGDDQFVIGQGDDGSDILSGNQSFEALWLSGGLNEKFYKDFSADGGTDWMFNGENTNLLSGLMAEYYTDVNEFTYDKNFVEQPGETKKGRQGRGASVLGGFKDWAQIDNVAQDIANQKTHYDLSGVRWAWNDKKGVFTTPGQKGSEVERSPEDLLGRNQIKYLYPDMFKEQKGIDYDGDGIIDTAPKKPIKFTTY